MKSLTSKFATFVSLAVLSISLFALTGCEPPGEENKVEPKATGTKKPADSHTHGAHNGHNFGFDDGVTFGESVYQMADNQSMIYLFEKDKKTAKWVKAKKITYTVQSGSKSQSWDLEPTDPNADGAASLFTSTDKKLMISLKVGGGKITFEDSGKTFSADKPSDPTH